MQQPIDYEPRKVAADPRASRRPLIVVGVVFFILNLALLAFASSGDSAGTFVAMIIGPGMNVLTALSALTFTGNVRRLYGWDARTYYLSCAIGLPIVAMVGDFAVIIAMGWIGC